MFCLCSLGLLKLKTEELINKQKTSPKNYKTGIEILQILGYLNRTLNKLAQSIGGNTRCCSSLTYRPVRLRIETHMTTE